MEQILPEYGLFKNTVTAIRMLYKNTKALPDGDILVSFPFIIFLDYVLRTSIDQIKEKKFCIKKKTRSRQYPPETI